MSHFKGYILREGLTPSKKIYYNGRQLKEAVYRWNLKHKGHNTNVGQINLDNSSSMDGTKISHITTLLEYNPTQKAVYAEIDFLDNPMGAQLHSMFKNCPEAITVAPIVTGDYQVEGDPYLTNINIIRIDFVFDKLKIQK